MEWTNENDYYVYAQSEAQPANQTITFTCRVKTPDPQTVVKIYWTMEKEKAENDLQMVHVSTKRNYVSDPMNASQPADRQAFKRREIEIIYNVSIVINSNWLNRDIFCAATVNIQGSPYKLDDCIYIVATSVPLFSSIWLSYDTYTIEMKWIQFFAINLYFLTFLQ